MAQKYTVKKGDSALTLGKKFGIPPQAILNQNRINSLTAGQTIRVPTTRNKGQAGYYSTGEGERKTVYINGNPVRMGPNSSITPNRQLTTMQQFIQNLTAGGSESYATPAMAPASLAGVPLQGLTQQQLYYLGTVPNPNTGGPKVNPSPVQFTPPPAPFSSAGSQARMNEAYTGFNPAMGAGPSTFSGGYNTVQPQPLAYTGQAPRPPAYGGSYNPTVQPVQPQQAAPFMTQAMLNQQQPLSTGYADYGQRINQGQTPTNALPTSQPAPLITPSSRAAGQAQFLAGQGINPESGYIPTRGDVWEMKANARRRRMAQNAGDVQQQETIAGNAQNTAVNWRV